MLKWCLGLFFMLFRRAKITSPFMKSPAYIKKLQTERSKKAIFKNRHSLFSFEKNMKGGSFANARKSISSETH